MKDILTNLFVELDNAEQKTVDSILVEKMMYKMACYMGSSQSIKDIVQKEVMELAAAIDNH